MLACVGAGVDLFEAFFPFQVTERGCALCFSFDISSDPERAGSAPSTGVVKCFNVIKLNIFNEVMRPFFFFFFTFSTSTLELINFNNSLLTFTSTNLKKRNQAHFKLYFNCLFLLSTTLLPHLSCIGFTSFVRRIFITNALFTTEFLSYDHICINSR